MDSIFLALAAAEAEKYVGATAPNPPVGACLVKEGQILALGAHKRAGEEHAEAAALRSARERLGAEALKGATIYVTLEPCNHYGKTPPCAKAILDAGIRHVVYGARDPNRTVKGGGAAALLEAGLEVTYLPSDTSRKLIDGFAKRFSHARPWVVQKLAYREASDGMTSTLSMIPHAGQKTFTSPASLKRAHLERRKCDAIITGMGTVECDRPLFTVRLVDDHPGKRRWLVVMSARGRKAPLDWIERQEREHGFEVLHHTSLARALEDLSQRGALRAMIEAGPSLSKAVMDAELWDEQLIFVTRTDSDIALTEHRPA